MSPQLRPSAPPPPPQRVERVTGSDWVPTRALGRSLLLAGSLLVGAVMLGRIDLVVVATPFVLALAFGLSRRPATMPELRLATVEEYTVEGAELSAVLSLGNADAIGYDLVVARTQHSWWLNLHAETADKAPDRPVTAALSPGEVADVVLTGQARRWGRHSIGPAAATAVAGHGLLLSRAVVTGSLGMKVFPVTEPFSADEAMPRAAGLVGQHRSRRHGEGGELAGVRQFAPGDRLRRIDWRTTLRSRQLHVAQTLSDRDAEVTLLLDVLAEAGRSSGIGGTASVFDITVRAAAAIAEHYLTLGDRVSMVEFGSGLRRLRAASGRRQYLTILEWLLDVKPSRISLVTPEQQLSTAISSNALVVVLTPLVDARSAGMLATLARGGRSVVAVDTLPLDFSIAAGNASNPWSAASYRLWLLERANVVGQLREHGVPVVPWAGANSLDLVLRDVARLSGRPQAVTR
ncbi:uncharacterized protein (DUF58 family) [Allocatelliglobosispora scoriae]|uniref:Uncharacterized protein (DUF58 family) n=1 Tax=Allocatelliglobosispora scoriae TaxID=643052 RepID=A0A841BTY2_9ACTN|nr:DUF58 domain-containing protein [Allocatelliglobosispora scoriae]MBB5870373.1 uncharacterized protein (DUF58 family) [Allocatelliglobosispora scoriae]